jgi:hypothetical protein
MSFHSALQLSPFEVLYGHSPRSFGITNDTQVHAPDIEQWLLECNLLQDVVRHHLHRAQQRMKSQVDKHHSEKEFGVGDKVYLRCSRIFSLR